MQTTNLPIEMTPEEAQWIEFESIRRLASKVLGTQFLSIGVVVVLFSMLYNQVDTPIGRMAWGVWLMLHAFLILPRLYMAWGYTKRQKIDVIQTPFGNTSGQFYLNNVRILSWVGVVWGSTVFLFNNETSSMTGILCFNFVLMYGVTTTIYISTHLSSLKVFVTGYSAGFLVAIALRMGLDLYHHTDALVSNTNLTLLATGVVLIVVLRRFGSQLNQGHMNALRMQYHNEHLIESLTEEKRIAVDAVASKNRFLASATHDMRQPVLALDLYANWLVEEPHLSPTLSPKIANSTRAVITLFDSLFDLARLAVGELSVSMEHVHIHDMLNDLEVQYQPSAQAKGLTLRMHNLEEVIWSDPVLLKRVVSNLMSNAIRYTEKGGILVAVRKHESGLRIEVWDTGVGIEEHEQTLVLQEFYKSANNAGTSDGFGLGLAIVVQLTSLLGCQLQMKSRFGRGTMMAIQF